MKKVLISTLVLGSLVAASAQDAGVNAFGNAYAIDPSVKVRAGSFEIGNNSAGIYGVSFGGNRIFNYFTAGVDIILSGPKTLKMVLKMSHFMGWKVFLEQDTTSTKAEKVLAYLEHGEHI